eukprot:TRINITY_DN2540_c0_g1_i1.p1 TRINITY_DN2540_c0_g1~~TRINITY_DN2540_c0_g1_i1.p1  ORF type:complete len:271 (+),score=86.36 TRINITY_DN2540_c0_g1_i1:28-813(+)
MGKNKNKKKKSEEQKTPQNSEEEILRQLGELDRTKVGEEKEKEKEKEKPQEPEPEPVVIDEAKLAEEREKRARAAEARLQPKTRQPATRTGLGTVKPAPRGGYSAQQSKMSSQASDLNDIRRLRAEAYAAQGGQTSVPQARAEPEKRKGAAPSKKEQLEEVEEAKDVEMDPEVTPEPVSPPATLSAAAQAAIARAEQGHQNLSKERREELAVRREKDELLGSIQVIAAAKGITVPFGLPSSSLTAMRQYKTQISSQKDVRL